MFTFILRRLLYSIPVLFASSFLIFVGVSAVGNPLQELRLNPLISEQTLQNISERKHLDEPIPVRYVYWLQEAVTDKFGTPLFVQTPIWDDLTRVVGHTLQLVIVAELIALLIGILIGVYSAIRQYSIFDYTATMASFLGFAMPVFWLALMLQILFTEIFLRTGVRVFYTSGLNSADNSCTFCVDRAQHLAIPVMTLAVLSIAQYSRYMRASMLEVINSDYIRTTRGAQRSDPRRHRVGGQLRRVDRRRHHHRDDLRARRDGAVLHQQPAQPGRLPRDGVADDHRDDDHPVQSDRRHHVRLPGSAHPL
jgi:peptide/nickel transport system permease protein